MNNISGKKKMLWIIDCIIFLFAVAIDQITKYFAVVGLKNQPSHSIINGVLELHYLENSGAAFGILKNQKFFFILVALVIVCAIIYLLYKLPDKKKFDIAHILLVMIASGAVGNLIDRLRFDYVIDYIYFSIINFPIFNVADIYVTVSTALVLILILFKYKEEDFNFLKFKEKKIREIK